MPDPRRAGVTALLAGALAACASAAPPAPGHSPPPTRPPSPEAAATPFDAALAAAAAWRAAGPEQLAARLAAYHAGLRADAAIQPAVMEQSAILQLAETPAWAGPVLSRLSAEDASTVRADLYAATELKALEPDALDSVPRWRIAAPLPAAVLRQYYAETQRRYGVPWQYLAAINFVETGFGRVLGDSYAGAQGPMQFIPSTWAAYAQGDVYEPHAAILAAGRFLADVGAPGDMRSALYHYNPSEHYVNAVSTYAAMMQTNTWAFDDYHRWQVYVTTVRGDALLAEGATY